MSQSPDLLAGLAAAWATAGMSPPQWRPAQRAGNAAYLRYKKVTSQR